MPSQDCALCSRLACSLWIPRIHNAISRLRKFLDGAEHNTCACVCVGKEEQFKSSLVLDLLSRGLEYTAGL